MKRFRIVGILFRYQDIHFIGLDMKRLFLLMIGVVIYNPGFSQGYLPGGIIFTHQAQIDSFPANYPGCTTIEGNVTIYGSDITRLDSLYALTSFGGDLYISFNRLLASLSGLENVTSIGGPLIIENDSALNNITGLRNLQDIGGYLYIFFNIELHSLSGFEKLTSIGDGIHIGQSPALTSLEGLEKVTSIGGGIWVFKNPVLKSLSGLDNIEASTIASVYIVDNDTLNTCDVKSLCDYLSGTVKDVNIHDNSPGCNSEGEVVTNCAIGINNNQLVNRILTISPNPANAFILVETPSFSNSARISLFDINGQRLKSLLVTGKYTILDIREIQAGFYFVRLSNDKTVEVGKFVKQ